VPGILSNTAIALLLIFYSLLISTGFSIIYIPVLKLKGTILGMTPQIKKVLFVDDDPDDHLIFFSAMDEIFPSISITSFYECDALMNYLTDLNRPLPDMIFLDYNMPGIDGSTCLKMIKKIARLLHIPVIIYSTSDSKKLIDDVYSHGAYKYLVKPDNIQKLKGELYQLISLFGTVIPD